jgi:hypothetical protein
MAANVTYHVWTVEELLNAGVSEWRSMTYCGQYEALENQFIDVSARHRLESVRAWKQGVLEAEQRSLIEQQTREESRALRSLLDHAAEHGCHRSS